MQIQKLPLKGLSLRGAERRGNLMNMQTDATSRGRFAGRNDHVGLLAVKIHAYYDTFLNAPLAIKISFPFCLSPPQRVDTKLAAFEIFLQRQNDACSCTPDLKADPQGC